MERDTKRYAAFENILVFENYPVDKSLEEGVAGIKIKNLKAFERTNFPLTVSNRSGKEMSVHIAFETSKFTDDLINKILSNFSLLVSQIIADPDSKLSGLTLLSEEERNKILFEWNDTAADVDIKCMHEMFTDAAKIPDRTALESGNKIYL
ncbi:MAG: hypothetical protein IPM96_07845 [Ignavibacteria bacterium]|nr:hypothetical protein [Ignavibacteria bacterium]